MSLTVVDAIKYAAYSGALEETWYAKLYQDDASSFLGISDKDLTVSGVQYAGVVNSWGDITESINLSRSSSSISDVIIECSNVLKYGKFSDELYGGTYKYLNRKVEIFTYINSTSLQLYTGRLVNAEFTRESVTLYIEGYRPWAGITVPQTLSPDYAYEPLAYGDFTADTNTNFFTSKAYYPMPLEYRKDNKVWFVAGQSLASDAECYFYDSSLDRFVELDESDSATTASGSVYLTGVPVKFSRVINFRPSAEGTDDFSATSSAYDEDANGASDTTTSARYPVSGDYDHDPAGGGDIDFDLIADGTPEPLGKPTAIYLKGRGSVTISSGGLADDSIILGYDLYSNGFTTTGISRDVSEGAGTTGPSNFSINITSLFEANDYVVPDEIKLVGRFHAEAPDGEVQGYVNVHDVYLYAEYELVFDADNKESSENFIQAVKYAYCGADGLTQSFTGGSGIAELPHEILRDLLKRFTDFDYADGNWSNWSSLDTARAGWDCRWWQLKPRDLGEILAQIQYEGCFIFKIKHDYSGADLIWVKDSYSSGDVAYTLDENDYDSIKIGLTDINELETKVEYNYQRHPAKSTYLQNTTYTNSTARTNWVVGTNENYKTKNLDFIAADVVYTPLSHTDPNDCVALYYDNINAEPRVMITADITNPRLIGLTAGDIIQFNDSEIDAYGKTWSDLYFMPVETKRSKGRMTTTFREVYEA